MELLADLLDFQYFMYEKTAPNRHVILIKNTQNGSSAHMILETGEVLESCLDTTSEEKVKKNLKKYRKHFLAHFKETQK